MKLQVQSNWKSVQLGDIAKFRNGINYDKTSFGIGIKIIGVKDFQDYLYPKYSTLDEMNPTGIVRSESVLKESDILFVRSNGNRQLIGRSLFIKELNEQVTHSAFTIRARFSSDQAYAKFYFYLFRTTLIRDIFSNQGSGTNISNLNQDILSRLSVPLPPLSIQQKIAAILSAYDDLIENNSRRIKILEEMAQAIYREWFVNFRFPGHEGVQMVESELGLVPEGWEVKTIEEAFEISGGGTPSTKVPEYWESGIINWYSPTDLTSSRSMFMDCSGNQISEFGLKNSSARSFPPFSVMMTSRATLGVISINTTDACTNQGFITCIPNERFPLFILYYWLKENVEFFISLGTGSTFKEITKGVFKTIKLVIPPSEVVSQFEMTVEPLAFHVLNMQRKNANLRRTRDILLPKLISGELDVSELDIQIPAA
ncbi:MAG: restriction endonuclease subunit S [Methanoregula sp.]